MLELLGPAMSITTAALLAQSSLLKTALDASTIHNAARLRNTGYEWPPLARSSRSHRTVMEWLLVAQSGRSWSRTVWRPKVRPLRDSAKLPEPLRSQCHRPNRVWARRIADRSRRRASECCSPVARSTGARGIAMPFSARKIRTRREFGDAAEW